MLTIDSSLRHELTVSRLVTGIVQSRIMPAYFDLSQAVKTALADYEPTMNRKDFDSLRRQVSLMVAEKMNAMWEGTTNDLFDLAKYESNHVVGELSGATAVSEAAITKAVNTPMVLAGATVASVGTWREYIAGATNSTQARIIDNTIRAGYESGATVQEMTKRLIGTKKNNYLDGLVTNTGAREAEALVRTGANHYANQARDVAAVEALGEEANGLRASLLVVEIPDDVDWYIEEYDGHEWVHHANKYGKGVTKSELAQRFGDAGEKAMDKMETLIDSLDENIAYKASSFVLEQVNGKARQKIEEVRSVNVFVMPPDKLSMEEWERKAMEYAGKERE